MVSLKVQTVTQSITSWTDTDRRMMARALELARKGAGQVSPGPLVGCVIVGPGAEIVGEGFYLFEELSHAETIALAQAGAKARAGRRTFHSNRTRITDAPLLAATHCSPPGSNASSRPSRT